MKKTLTAMVMVLVFSPVLRPELREEQRYVNLSFTVWQLTKGVAEAARRINTPIPEVFRESWICDLVALDVSKGKAATRVVEKEGFRFVVTAALKGKLTIQVFEKEKERFRFIHNRPSTVDYIFTSSDRKTFLMEVAYSVNNHPIVPFPPGIRIKQRAVH